MAETFLQIPVKKTATVDFVVPLSKHIKNTFSDEVLNENKETLSELNQLRGNAVVRMVDKHETSLEGLQRYYDQLVTMEAKLPIAEDQIRISFTWYDAFDKGSIFGSTKCSLTSGAYERFCVLFNIGALLSQLAAQKGINDDDNLKVAAKYFQQSAGIYAYLKDNVYPVLQTVPTPDLAVSCLVALSAIMLAQAQDCIYRKASSDKMKDALVAKVAMQAADFYQEASRAITNYELRSTFEKEWISALNCKFHYFTAVAEYHQANVNLADGSYGEQVGRLQKASQSINAAIKECGHNPVPDVVKHMNTTIGKLAPQAKKDNEFIYNEKVPSSDSLKAIGRAPLAKPLPVSSPMTTTFHDLFTRLVPIQVHQALATFESKKDVLVKEEITKVRDATNELNGILASLNLPAAIEDLSGSGDAVPQSVLDKARDIKDKGGLGAIDQLMQNLPDLLTRNREVLDETFRMLDEEEREDQQMREHFKERWTPSPSSKLTVQLREEGAKYRTILDNATNADQVVKDKYNTHRRGLEVLSKSESDIAASIPKRDTSATTESSIAAQELTQQMATVNEMKKQREDIEKELNGTSVDMQSKFLQAIAAEGALDADRISEDQLSELFTGLKTQVEGMIEKQEEVVGEIKTSNDKFMFARQHSESVNQRDQVLKDLAAAYDAYVELKSNLEEGTKFYNDLTEYLLKFQCKVNDLVFARKTEKEDLSKQLQESIAKQPAAVPPPAPSHHQDTSQNRPPNRPPPPQQRPPAPSSAPAYQPPQPQHQPPPPQQQPPSPHQQPPSPHAPMGSAPPQFMPQQQQQVPHGGMPYPQQPHMMPQQPGMYAPQGYGYGGYAPPQPYPQQYGQPANQPAPYPQQQYAPQQYSQQQPPQGGYPGYQNYRPR